MQKGILVIFLTFLIFGMLMGFPLTVAYHGDSSGSGSDDSGSSDSDDNSGSDSSGSSDDENEDENDKEKEDDKDDGEDDNGDKVKLKFEIRRTIVNADGSISKIRIKIEEKIEDGVIKRKIKIKDETKGGEFEAKTKLELKEVLINGEESIFAILSNGNVSLINLMPDDIARIALERLQSRNLTLELKEVKHKNVPKVVYHVEANKTGKFLGIFKMKLKVEAQIDPETGEFIGGVTKPWWAFLVTGEDSDQTGKKVTLCHIPPGDPSAAKTISVGSPAVNAHLAHGDTLGACEGETPPENETEEDENQMTVELIAENNSNESGVAVLVEENEQITLTINMTGAPENVSQPAHIHLGSCPEVEGIQYPLTNILDGESITIINVTLDQLESELPLAINVHKSVNESSVYVSCGDIIFN